MQVKSAEFVKSSSETGQCPENNLPEYAFIGRSNVGKSSLINMLTDRKGLAKISGTPGKTQLINHFLIDDSWYLVDLPGYGYAKVSKKLRKGFNKIITDYLINRQNIVCVFMLIDSRHEPLKNDLEFITWLGENEVPFVLTFTKADKLSSSELNKNLKTYKTRLLQEWESLPKLITTSSTSRIGKEEILNFISATNASINSENNQDKFVR